MNKPTVFEMPDWFLFTKHDDIPMQIRVELWEAVLENSEYAVDGSDTLTIKDCREPGWVGDIHEPFENNPARRAWTGGAQ